MADGRQSPISHLKKGKVLRQGTTIDYPDDLTPTEILDCMEVCLAASAQRISLMLAWTSRHGKPRLLRYINPTVTSVDVAQC